MSVRPTRRAPLALALALVLAGCSYQPTLLGGADPEDAAVPGSAWAVLYTVSCLRPCDVTYTRDREIRTEEVEGTWQQRVRIAESSRTSVTLMVRPLDDLGVVRRAGIDVDGRRAARGDGQPGTPVSLTARLVR